MRWRELGSPEARAVLLIQDELLSALRDYLRERGFVEVIPPVIGPTTDPGLRGAGRFTLSYYGMRFYLMSSIILYKQALVRSVPAIFAVAPSVREEPPETALTGRHLTEFRQVDVERAGATLGEAMSLAEGLVVGSALRVVRERGEELKLLGREPEIPRLPLPRLDYWEAVDLARGLGAPVRPGEELTWEAERLISREVGACFVVGYPEGARGFYYRRDPARPGRLLDFDLLLPEGYGEVASGGERATDPAEVEERMRRSGEDPEEYSWYLEMLREGVPPSAG
ncbi:MAG: asparagine ligase, partial [Thermoproteota archaeon]